MYQKFIVNTHLNKLYKGVPTTHSIVNHCSVSIQSHTTVDSTYLLDVGRLPIL